MINLVPKLCLNHAALRAQPSLSLQTTSDSEVHGKVEAGDEKLARSLLEQRQIAVKFSGLWPVIDQVMEVN